MHSTDFLEKIAKLKVEDLDQIKGFGPILAKNLIDFTSSKRFETLLEKLKDLENKSIVIEIAPTGRSGIEGPLSGQTICITGSFDQPRSEIKAYLAALGANTTESVSKKTTILLVGSDPGSKVEKAKELGIKIFESVTELKQEFKI